MLNIRNKDEPLVSLHDSNFCDEESPLLRREFLGLGIMFLVGCGSLDTNNPAKKTSSGSESKGDGIVKESEYLYLVEPPLIAPDNFSVIKASDGFSLDQAYYLNNALYFLKNVAVSSFLSDLANAIGNVPIRPFKREMVGESLIGGGSALAVYENGTIYIDKESPDFESSAKSYFPLVESLGHEFCHYLGNDKPLIGEIKDPTPLFKMEIRAHKKTVEICEAVERYIDSLKNTEASYIAEWKKISAAMTYFRKDTVIRYQLRSEVCQSTINLLIATQHRIAKLGPIPADIDQLGAQVLNLALELRDANGNGQAELQGYRLLVKETLNLAAQMNRLPGFDEKSFLDALRPMPQLIDKFENHLAKLPN